MRPIGEIKDELRLKLKNFSYVTLSGEINISRKQLNAPVFSESGLIANIKACAAALSGQYPRFKVTVDAGINEITVKIFALRAVQTNGAFLEELRVNLEGLLSSIYDGDDDLQARLHIMGYIDSFRSRQDYVYLNNQRAVKYEITSVTANESLASKVNFIVNKTSQ